MHLGNGSAQRRVPVSFSNLYVLEKVLWKQRELLLLEKYAAVNPELKELWEDHILYEKQVEKLEAKAYRTPTGRTDVKTAERNRSLKGRRVCTPSSTAITNRKATNVVHRGQDISFWTKSEA